jgi:hypothetical protein
MFEGGDTPWLTPAELGAMGFTQVSFPTSLILRSVDAIASGLDALRRHADGAESLRPFGRAVAARAMLDKAVEIERWRSVESG